MSPSNAPSAMETFSPTILDVVVPFRLTYTLPGTPTSSAADLAIVEQTTDAYVEEIVIDHYASVSGTSVQDFVLELIVDTVGDGSTISIDYQVTVEFFVADTRDPSPTEEEVEAVIASTFDGNNFDVYLDLLQNLGSDNVFSGTTTYCYGVNC